MLTEFGIMIPEFVVISIYRTIFARHDETSDIKTNFECWYLFFPMTSTVRRQDYQYVSISVNKALSVIFFGHVTVDPQRERAIQSLNFFIISRIYPLDPLKET